MVIRCPQIRKHSTTEKEIEMARTNYKKALETVVKGFVARECKAYGLTVAEKAKLRLDEIAPDSIVWIRTSVFSLKGESFEFRDLEFCISLFSGMTILSIVDTRTYDRFNSVEGLKASFNS